MSHLADGEEFVALVLEVVRDASAPFKIRCKGLALLVACGLFASLGREPATIDLDRLDDEQLARLLELVSIACGGTDA